MVIPSVNRKAFYENLVDCYTVKKTINDHEFVFIVEKTKPNYKHACSIDDIIGIISYIQQEDYGDLRYFVLRQPKKKEVILSPVWGRWILEYTFKKETNPAIVLEALDYTDTIEWSKKLCVEDQNELERLIEDGHMIIDSGRNYVINYDICSVRNTQLYRTIPHEFGHYVQYQSYVKSYSHEQWINFPSAEKEKFAHAYADNLLKDIKQMKVGTHK